MTTQWEWPTLDDRTTGGTLVQALNNKLRRLGPALGGKQDDLGWVNPKRYGATGNGVTDDTTALQRALAVASATPSGTVIVPPGTYRYTSGLTVPAHVTLLAYGVTATVGSGNRAPTCLLKDGAFDGVTLGGEGAAIRGLQLDGAASNSGAGLVVGAGRCQIERVAVTSQGGSGVVVGVSGANCNLWRITDLITVGNGSHGLYITDPDSANPDVNGGLLLGLDSRSNGGDGLRVDNAFDNNYYGVTCQSNTGYGIHLVGSASHKCQGQVFWFPYTESNAAGEIILDANADYCVVFGYRTGGGLVNSVITDNGTHNLIYGQYGSELAGPFIRSALQIASVLINNTAISGQWELRQNASTRALEIAGVNTSATPLLVSLVHDTSGDVALAIGATPATTGAVRLRNGDNVAALNNAGSGNVVLVRLSSSDFVQVGSSGAAEVQLIAGSDAIRMLSGGHWAPSTDDAQTIGNGSLRWQRLYLSGNAMIRGVDYTWPSANASGVLTNNGSGTLSWAAGGGSGGGGMNALQAAGF